MGADQPGRLAARHGRERASDTTPVGKCVAIAAPYNTVMIKKQSNQPPIKTSTWRTAGVALAGTVLAAVMAACNVSGAQVAYDYSCPEDDSGEAKDLNVLAFLDLTASGRDESLLSERLDVLQVELERAVDCDARATVLGFTNSTAAHTVLLDRAFDLEGATEIARDRQIPDAIDSVMTEIRSNVDGSLDRLPADGSDINAMFVLAAEHSATITTPDTSIEIYGFTDGISTAGPVNLNTADLSTQQAIDLAATIPASDLHSVDAVVIRGISKVAGTAQPPTDYVDAVKAHLTELCHRAVGDEPARHDLCTITTETIAR